MIHHGSKRFAVFTVTSMLALAAAMPAHAQEADEPAAEEEEIDFDDIEEMVVTVERREQSLQDLAGTATAFDGAELRQLGVKSIEDLSGRFPGLQIGNNQGNIEIFIRGVGNENNTELGLPRVSTLLDGVFVPRPRGFGSVFFDIERVEVFVGPQGTLRGRNATGGSVNVVPFKPGLGVWDAAAEVTYGNFNTLNAQSVLNVPVGGKLAVRLAANYLNHDSYYNNVGPVQEIDVAEARDDFSFRGSVLWEPTDRLSVLLVGDYLQERGTGFTGTNFANPVGNGVDIDDIPDPRAVIARGFTPDLDTSHWGIKGQIDYDFDWFSVEYIGSFRSQVYDYDAATPLTPFFEGVFETLEPFDEQIDNFSRFNSITDSDSIVQELRFHRDEGPFIFSAGAFYFEEDQFTFLGSTGDRTLFFSGQEFNLPVTDRESYAGYFDFTYEVTDKLRLTGGVRYSRETLLRFGTNATYGFAIGGENFSCCGGVRIGTEGFEFAERGRTIFNPDTDGSGTVDDQEILDFFFNGVREFGIRDNVDDIFANGPVFGDAPPEARPECLDTFSGDFFNCPPDGLVTFAVPFANQISIQNGLRNEDYVSWRARLEYDVLPSTLAYGLVTRSQNSGGFNDNIPGSDGLAPFNPAGATETAFQTDTLAPEFDFETLTLYEFGLKNQFDFDAWSMTLNATGFYYDYDDQQLTTLTSVASVLANLNLEDEVTLPDGVGTQIVSFTFNAANSRIFGAQFDGGFRLPYNVNLDWQFLWLETEIADSIPIDDPRTLADDPTDISGNDLTRSPRFSLAASLSQSFNVPTGRVDWIASMGWRGRQFLTIFNSEQDIGATRPLVELDDQVEAYFTADLGLKYVHGEGRWEVETFVNNVTNQEEEAALILTPFDNTRFFTPPRTYGLRLRVLTN